MSSEQLPDGISERVQLQEGHRSAMWHPESGVVVCILTRSLPLHVCQDSNSLRIRDYSNPRYLDDSNVYIAFYPRKPIHHGSLFSVLAVTDEQLDKSIETIPNTTSLYRYRLAESVRLKWQDLESSLRELSSRLIARHPHAKKFPILSYPKYPYEFGYNDGHQEPQFVVRCARRARQAFILLSALVSFSFSLWLTKYEDNCFEEAFSMLAAHPTDPFPRAWLDLLRESIVCDLGRGLRPGGFLFPFSTLWGPWAYRFCRAGVPIWFIWGKDPRSLTPADPGMAHYYLPPDTIVAQAKERLVTYDNSILPLKETYRFNPESIPPPLDTFPDTNFVSSETYAENDMYVMSDETYISAAPVPAVDRTLIVNAGSGQRAGETWEMFVVRMEAVAKKHRDRETPEEKQRREALEIHAQNHGYSKKSCVFYWEQDGEDPTYYRRTAIAKSEVEFEWSQYTPHQRRFWPHANEWDLCPFLPRCPGNTVTDDMIDDDEGYNPDDLVIRRDGTLAVQSEPGNGNDMVGATMLRTVQVVVSHLAERIDEFQVTLWPIEEYLRWRHGYNVSLARSWYPEFHTGEKKLDVHNSERTAIKHLLYGPVEMAFTPSMLTSIIDFYNTIQGCGVPYSSLPLPWDIGCDSLSTEPLFCVLRYLKLRRVTLATDTSGILYVLSPSPESNDNSTWSVATTSATAVLLVYRKRWYTMEKIARSFLELGIPFYTVLERKQGEGPCQGCLQYKFMNLGFREKDFKPRQEDYFVYQQKRDDLLCSPLGRAFRMMGGIVGRIAAEVVSDSDVLRGPIQGNMVVGHHDDVEFVDDYVNSELVDIVSGVYHVSMTVGGACVSHSSWWPKHSTWMMSGYAGDQWSPQAEVFYVTRKGKLSRGILDIRTSSKWKDDMKLYQRVTQAIYRGSELFAARFLAESPRVF